MSGRAKGALLCAGLGTRLRPLTDERPKALLPLANVPLARYGLENLRRAGIAAVGVNLHHHAAEVRAEFGDEVAYSEEPEILGTGGALKRLAEILDLGDDDLVVHNGKVAIDLDVAAVIARHRETGALATMVVRETPDARAWGAIDVSDDGFVRDLLADGRHMFCGVHVLRAEFVRALPAGASDSVREGYIPAVRRGARVAAFVATGYFAEHSTPARYLASNFALLAGARLPQATWPTTGEGRVLAGRGVRVGRGAAVGPDVALGDCAVVEDGARVTRAVVWNGARASGDVRDAVVTRGRIVSIPHAGVGA